MLLTLISYNCCSLRFCFSLCSCSFNTIIRRNLELSRQRRIRRQLLRMWFWLPKCQRNRIRQKRPNRFNRWTKICIRKIPFWNFNCAHQNILPAIFFYYSILIAIFYVLLNKCNFFCYFFLRGSRFFSSSFGTHFISRNILWMTDPMNIF